MKSDRFALAMLEIDYSATPPLDSSGTENICRPCVVTLLAGIFLILIIDTAGAQDTLRSSIGPSALARFSLDQKGSSIRFGPFNGNLSATLGFNYTDNSNLSETHKIPRTEFFEGINLDMSWIVSHQNRLDLTLGGQLNQDITGGGGNDFNISLIPDSKIQFQFQVADLRFTLYDRFSYTQDPTQDSSASNTSNLNRFDNTSGISMDWLVERFVWEVRLEDTYSTQGSYTNGNTVNTITNNSSGNRETLRLGTSLTTSVNPTWDAGLDINFTKSFASIGGTANSVSIGPFLRGKLSRLVEFELAAGIYLVDVSGASPVNYYISTAVRHKINRNLQLYASFVRDLQFAAGNELVEDNTINCGVAVLPFKPVQLSVIAFADFGKQLNGPGASSYTQYGFRADAVYDLGKKWKAFCGYRYTKRDSDLQGDSYDQNYINCGFNYAF
jgi:hypothetical protein